jgi:hypothetical protein
MALRLCGCDLLCWRGTSISDYIGREQIGCCLVSAVAPHGADHAVTSVGKQDRAVISPYPGSVSSVKLYRTRPIPAAAQFLRTKNNPEHKARGKSASVTWRLPAGSWGQHCVRRALCPAYSHHLAILPVGKIGNLGKAERNAMQHGLLQRTILKNLTKRLS